MTIRGDEQKMHALVDVNALRRIGITLLPALLISCTPADGSASGPAAPEISQPLTIVGFNYTDRYIDSFEVNGQGGGNVHVSTPTVGGGKGTCCIGWKAGTRLPQKVHVKWVSGGCMKELTDSDGYTFKAPLHAFKELDAELADPVPSNPGYFEVHFYPDDHVEVAITASPSAPRLRLSPTRAKPTYADKCGVQQ
jgi:hypothetical protein